MPPFMNRSYTITADLIVPPTGDHRSLRRVCVKDGKLKRTYSDVGVEMYKQESSEALPTGQNVQVRLDFAAARVMATGETVSLSIDGKSSPRIGWSTPSRSSSRLRRHGQRAGQP